jgi:ribosomal protein L7/L12
MMNPALVVILLCTFLVVILMQMRFNAMASGLARLSRLEAKVDLLLKNANIKYDPTANVPADVVEALRRGAKIEAIKRYRQATGVGLKEAKDFVEALQGKIGTF